MADFSSTFHFLLTFLLLLRPSLSSAPNLSELFEIWCAEHGKTYSSAEEKLYRFGVFADNYDFVSHHNNLGDSSYALSLNAFADLTHHEFKASRLGFSLSAALRNSQPVPPQEPSPPLDVPDSLDWRKEGAVTAVKDQGSCGACWSFAATGAIEGINKIKTGSLISLSEQELVDCDRLHNSGCAGGLMDYAYQFVITNHGIDTEDDYPYQGRDGSCRKDKLKRNVVTIDGYIDVAPSDEKRLREAVAVQPVSVGICGSERAFQLYSKDMDQKTELIIGL
ncbi:cysteine protease XCP1 isoform X2 [Momordica charantia]|uniref:Cysteine protease XCP1 isoform X2 n=1 Tax=Momordica charantia TaxID=3673 RepID=A0A6J1CT68_MOMCH|nr:cysteine protease XCP1 isoform X2 [Momordica charantia]